MQIFIVDFLKNLNTNKENDNNENLPDNIIMILFPESTCKQDTPQKRGYYRSIVNTGAFG